ncbi:MAG: LLM class F420-dependent oxidoreductase, partial [Dehalococcoidia bacterium]|nr:LLM class F420-dependent oxidoreductase [Dehalococcoidia bacterium]
SLEGKWQEMVNEISDEMLEEFATIGTYDELAPKIKERWGTISSTIFLGLPAGLARDEALLRGIIDDLHRG